MGFIVPAVGDKASHRQRERWQITTKWLIRRFLSVNENEKDRIVNLAIPRNTQKATQFGLSVVNGELNRPKQLCSFECQSRRTRTQLLILLTNSDVLTNSPEYVLLLQNGCINKINSLPLS